MRLMAMTLRLSSEAQEALRATALREGRSQHAVVMEAIERYTSDRARRRDEAIARIVAEDAELLDRLAR